MNKFLAVFACVFSLFLGACNNDLHTETWTIASERANCVGVAPMKCLLIKKEGQTDWEFFYQEIEGFDYEPGYEYVIKISKETVEAPPADKSTFKYIFKKQVSKVQKASENLPV